MSGLWRNRNAKIIMKQSLTSYLLNSRSLDQAIEIKFRATNGSFNDPTKLKFRYIIQWAEKKYVQSENIKRGLFGFLVTSLQDIMYVLLRMYRVFVWLFNIRSKISINFAFLLEHCLYLGRIMLNYVTEVGFVL